MALTWHFPQFPHRDVDVLPTRELLHEDYRRELGQYALSLRELEQACTRLEGRLWWRLGMLMTGSLLLEGAVLSPDDRIR